jgi:hypothetical protein
MYLCTQRMSHPLEESLPYLIGELHARLIGVEILYPLPSGHHADSHKGTDQGAAGLAIAGNPSRQRAPCHKGGLVSDLELLLQTCKHGLASTPEFHVILDCLLFDFVNESLSIGIHSPPFFDHYFYFILLPETTAKL